MPDLNPSTPSSMMIAVVQAQDAEAATEALLNIPVSVTRLPSVGGFLGRRNTTLFIGCHNTSIPAVLSALQQTCRQRIEYIAVPLESAPLPLPAPTPITIGGATVFTLPLEHYEEI
ncbi:MAG: cyclic-di-AMP receptor [Anaerolineaceae bacterium]